MWCPQSADACGGSRRGESLRKSHGAEAELAIAVPQGLKLSGRVSSCAMGVGWRLGGSFCCGRLSALGPGSSHGDPRPGGAGEWAQERGTPNRSEGKCQDGGKCHRQKQLNFLIKPVASVSARCSFPFALAQPHLHHGPIAGLPRGCV